MAQGDRNRRARVRIALCGLLLAALPAVVRARIVIQELLYEPASPAEPTAFVELSNAGDQVADLSAWHLDGDIHYTLPVPTYLAPGGLLVIAEEPASLDAAFGVPSLGPWAGRLGGRAGTIILRRADGQEEDRVQYRLGFPWPTDTAGRSIVLVDSDLDNDLGGSWRAAGYPVTGHELDPDFVPAPVTATPGQPNIPGDGQPVPPQIRQVKHDPAEPAGGEAVRITAKVTDPQGVAAVSLTYQVVPPGAYLPARIPLTLETLRNDPGRARGVNPAFVDPAAWHSLTLRDDGTGADEQADDRIYSVVLPGQPHRSLIRYRLRATDAEGASVAVPLLDDPTLNFSIWVYDGVPPYRADVHSVLGTPHTYDPAVMTSLPVHHLVTRDVDLAACLAYEPAEQISAIDHPGRRVANWEGAWVHGSHVYDHVAYRLRGGPERYAGRGKRNLRIQFARGHDAPWRSLNLDATWDPRSEQLDFGLPAQVNTLLYDLMGVAAPSVQPIQLRVVDNAAEAPDPYHGDFWGLFLAREAQDATFLTERDLPEGNLYPWIPGLEDPVARRSVQGRTAVTDGSDVERVRAELTAGLDSAALTARVDTEQAFAFLAVSAAVAWEASGLEAFADHEATWFFVPGDATNPWGRLQLLPGDTARSWAPVSPPCTQLWQALNTACRLGVESSNGSTALRRDFRNGLRRFRDLLWNPATLGPLVEGLGARVAPLAAADRDRWTHVPDWGRDAGAHNASTRTLSAQVAAMTGFVADQAAWLDTLADGEGDLASLPQTPVVTDTGAPDHPIDGLTFVVSPFDDPQGDETFAALRWCVGAVPDPNTPPEEGPFEIQTVWDSGPLPQFQPALTLPGTVLRIGGRYRLRATVQDNTGRWSHASAPLSFVVGPPADARLARDLRITEIMYHPADPPQGHPDAEFIELSNVGTEPLSLGGVSLTKAVDFDFPDRALAPREVVLVVQDRSVFEAIYGSDLPVVGQYRGRLANDGDTLRLRDPYDQIIEEIPYRDGWYALTDGEGFSLVPNPTAAPPVDVTRPEAWRPSHDLGGSPGWPEAAEVPPEDSVVINEILAHSHDAAPDWVELHNTTDQTIHLGGWFLSDSDADRTRYEIAPGTTIGPHGYVVFYEDLHFGNPLDPGTQAVFALSDDGETLYLTSGVHGEPTSYREQETFGASATGISFGRWFNSTGAVNFVPLETATPNAPNARPLVGPVVINEIYYNPDGDKDAEYVEILNISDQPVRLYDAATGATWRFTDDPESPSIDLRWSGSQDVVLEPGRVALLVNDASALLHSLAVAPGTRIYTWPRGSLSNAGERLQLSDFGELNNGVRHWIRIDRVAYADRAPWPSTPDGQGHALQRLDPGAYGNDPANWRGGIPTPGIP